MSEFLTSLFLLAFLEGCQHCQLLSVGNLPPMGGKLSFGTRLQEERAASAPPLQRRGTARAVRTRPHHDSMKLKKIASTIVTAAPESDECSNISNERLD
jgi:hypothetical protein